MPDDDPSRQLRWYRAREFVVGIALAGFALATSAVYFLVLRDKTPWPFLILLVALEWLVMFGVYLLLTSKMRRRRP